MGVREKSVRARAAGRMFLAWMTAMVVAAAALGALRQVGTPAVAVHALGPGGLIKIDMESNELSVEEKDGKLVLSSDLRKLTDKENELRAKHMREEFQADQLPSVTLTIARADLKLPLEGQSLSAEVPGALTLHGVTKPVHVAYSASRSGATYNVSGTTDVDYTQFLGRKISRLGVTVQPLVKVEAKFKLNDG